MASNGIEGMHISNPATGRSEILLVPKTELGKLFSLYFHEVGHELAIKLSFIQGDVLSVNETKKISVPLSRKEFARIVLLLFAESIEMPLQMKGIIKRVADRILCVYSKGKWNPSSIEIKHASREEIVERIANQPRREISTLTVDQNKRATLRYTRKGRNDEVPAIGVEEACMRILTNSLNHIRFIDYGEASWDREYKKSSHGRAKKLVRYMYAKEIEFPSNVDIQKSKKRE